mmetsp:Transcript_38982/g.92330  ORF Transcript_38982/g.92330 Transcript_38982/m.92330 type:complete len:521 (+) Transcript_38982:596-2158(+)
MASHREHTHVMVPPKGKPCRVAADCTRLCVEACTLAVIDSSCASGPCRHECERQECSDELRHHPGGENCRHTCNPDCMRRCRHSTEAAAHQQLERCLAVEEPPCLERCPGGGGGGDGCAGACRSEARARCEADARRECLGACGRHVCAPHGRCECPVFLRGDSMCTDYSWLRESAPKNLSFCFQSIFEDEFHMNKFGETDIPLIASSLILQSNHTDGERLTPYREYLSGFRADGSFPALEESPFPDLPDLADFSTCAVVGSSGELTGRGLGHEIDRHTAVIRFNDAPTRGFEVDVGSKTTLRVQNSIYCGFCEDGNEILLPYTIRNLSMFCRPRENQSECRVYSSSNELRNYVSRFYEPFLIKFAENSTWYRGDLMKELNEETQLPGPSASSMVHAYNQNASQQVSSTSLSSMTVNRGFGWRDSRTSQHYLPLLQQRKIVTQRVNGTRIRLKDISAGMTGIFAAMHMCYQVDVYGFGHSGTYYYPKFKRTDRKWERIHYWELEHLCQQAHGKYLDRIHFH